MTEHKTHHTLVALQDVLGALDQDGPLSSDELARQLGLTRFDARMVLVDAHAHGLVRINGRSQWAITKPGREALAAEPEPRPRDRAPAWQERLRPAYLGRWGLALAAGLAVSAGGVAVANSGLPSFSGPPSVVPAAHGKAKVRRRHRRSIVRPTSGFYYATTVAHHYAPLPREIGQVRLTRALPRLRSGRLTSLTCSARYAGTRAAEGSSGRSTSRAVIGKRSATSGLGDRAPSAGRAAGGPQTLRCVR